MTAAAEHGELFAALSDPTRRKVLDLLAARGEGSASGLAAAMPVSRPAVVKHLAVLDRAGLVESRRRGREVLYSVRPEPLESAARWMALLAADWDRRLAALKQLAEEGVSPATNDSLDHIGDRTR
jgi:DNA-binding transcriptional ArsR family regulator